MGLHISFYMVLGCSIPRAGYALEEEGLFQIDMGAVDGSESGLLARNIWS